MHLENDMTALFRQFKRFHRVSRIAGRVSVDNQVAVLVVSSRITNGSDETLGIVVDGLIAVFLVDGLVPMVIVVQHLVVGLEEQLLVVVLELLGYLLPQIFVVRLDIIVGRRAGMQPLFTVAGIVMHVNDTVHTVVYHIVNHFFHTIHPCILHLTVLVHFLIPGHWHTDSAKTSLLHHLQEFGLRHGLSPARFMLFCGGPGFRRICSIQRVTQVPAHAHVLDSVFGRFKTGSMNRCAYHRAAYQK